MAQIQFCYRVIITKNSGMDNIAPAAFSRCPAAGFSTRSGRSVPSFARRLQLCQAGKIRHQLFGTDLLKLNLQQIIVAHGRDGENLSDAKGLVFHAVARLAALGS